MSGDRGIAVLQGLLDVGQELVGDRSVDDAMVVAERQVTHRPDRDRIVDDHRTLFDIADAEDRDLRLVDDRHSEQGTEHARVGNRECAAGHLFGFQLFRAGARRKIGDGAAEAEEIPFAGVLDHRHDQPPVESHGHTEIDVLVIDDIFAVN